VRAAPPSFDGAVHANETLLRPEPVMAKSKGTEGATAANTVNTLEKLLVPTKFMAVTLKS
jgi:hypothetical protein